MTIAFFAVSCTTAKSLSASSAKNERSRSTGNLQTVPLVEGSKRVYKNIKHSTANNGEMPGDQNSFLNFPADIENIKLLQFKYAVLTDVPVEALANLNLLNFMEEWYGTPYRYGGSTKQGIDCSAFTSSLMASVFGTLIPRTVKEQYVSSQRIARSQLQQGDLVFFKTRRGVSHVGVYLVNNKFVHASTSNGVMISDLEDDYFNRRYAGAGRIKIDEN